MAAAVREVTKAKGTSQSWRAACQWSLPRDLLGGKRTPRSQSPILSGARPAQTCLARTVPHHQPVTTRRPIVSNGINSSYPHRPLSRGITRRRPSARSPVSRPHRSIYRCSPP